MGNRLAKDSPDMAKLEVMTLQLLITFSKDLETMEHLLKGLRSGALMEEQ